MRQKTILDRERFMLTTKELAHVMGVDNGNVRRYAVEGMPKEGRGRWHLPDCVQWLMRRGTEKAEEIDYDLGTRKAYLYESQEQKNRIEIAVRLGELYPADEVDAYLATLAQQFIDSLESIPSRIDANPETVAAVEAEVRAARLDLARSLQDVEKSLRDIARASDATTGSPE